MIFSKQELRSIFNIDQVNDFVMSMYGMDINDTEEDLYEQLTNILLHNDLTDSDSDSDSDDE